MRRILRRLLTANGAWAEERCSTKLLRQDSPRPRGGRCHSPLLRGLLRRVGVPAWRASGLPEADRVALRILHPRDEYVFALAMSFTGYTSRLIP
jgi:hypothetical protein